MSVLIHNFITQLVQLMFSSALYLQDVFINVNCVMQHVLYGLKNLFYSFLDLVFQKELSSIIYIRIFCILLLILLVRYIMDYMLNVVFTAGQLITYNYPYNFYYQFKESKIFYFKMDRNRTSVNLAQ